MTISKKNRDIAMKAICDFHAERLPNYSIGPEYLYSKGLPQEVDALQVVDVLCAMGYISYTDTYGDGHRQIRLTDAGKCYFEKKVDRDREKRIENIRYIITTAIAVLALVLAGISLAAQLGLIQLPKA